LFISPNEPLRKKDCRGGYKINKEGGTKMKRKKLSGRSKSEVYKVVPWSLVWEKERRKLVQEQSGLGDEQCLKMTYSRWKDALGGENEGWGENLEGRKNCRA